MIDRELLELAVKAAGIEGILWHDKHPGGWLDGCGAPSTWWNPLTDDGDALRLAVKCRLSVNIGPTHTEVTWYSELDDMAGSLIEWNADDASAATRRAIVRAAAEIGKQMP